MDPTLIYLIVALVAMCAALGWVSTPPPPAQAPAVHIEERTPARSLPAPDRSKALPIEDLVERWPSAPVGPCPSISPMMATNMGCDQ